jgi:hypothetical protein
LSSAQVTPAQKPTLGSGGGELVGKGAALVHNGEGDAGVHVSPPRHVAALVHTSPMSAVPLVWHVALTPCS